ncbi:MAG: glutamate-1-semialdehyde 2,1-aminomutase [Planctomycetota bacterium]|jgi:glutamate-1-semialdehyde 2,1-aminomutase|nr:glutamate-1-semialdehyde 2,1-aminomutase [Planctomycetota bacterium]
MSGHSISEELFARASQALPGGVSSPVRAFRAVGGTPVFIDRAEGAHFTDVDGADYLDFVMSWGPMILGHAHPRVLEAVYEAAAAGTSYGAPHRGELELAQRVAAQYPGAQRVRFTSSGTEATMSAIRLARGVTGRDRIVKFSGCYHGHGDCLLVAAGSGGATFGTPSSAGVPGAIAGLTTVLPLDDPERFLSFMESEGNQVAAVIVEPIPANNGLLLQRPEFLNALREATRRHGALLIFDEVISGFRVAPGGAAELFGIEPDLATFGKVIGGGFPVGAFAGPARYFDHLAPEGPVYQAGTLSGNPVAMAAGLVTLDILEETSAHAQLEELGRHLEKGFDAMMAGKQYPVRLQRLGSLFWLSFSEGPVARCAEEIPDDIGAPYATFFHACLEAGVYLAPSAYEIGFLSTAHTVEDVDTALRVFERGCARTFAQEGIDAD